MVTAITMLVSWWLYQYTVDLLTARLRDRLVAIVRTAAVEFDARDLEQLRVTEDYRKPQWQKVVGQLQKIRGNNPDVVFAYILRLAPGDPSKVVFVADADSLDPFAKIDLNHDGVIDDADALVTPGSEYEDVPREIFEGLSAPVTNQQLYKDQWGWLISGYAPIRNDRGETVAVIAVDIRDDNFFNLTRQTFRPFLAFVIFLFAIITVEAVLLYRMMQTQVRQFREIDRQKDELLSIVSHQLGGPITSLRWTLEGLADGDHGALTEEQQHEVSAMQRTTVSLTDLVNILLDLSRIELGRLAVHRSDVDLDVFLDDLLRVIEVFVKEKGVMLTVERPKKLPAASLDPRLTRMTLENLLNNAVKYTPAGGQVTFAVTTENGRMHCRIADTGCGIPKEELPLLFSKLYRASNVRDTVPGNGFGLYIAKGAIEQQGGTIHCDSTVGAGTTFDVALPITPSTTA